MWDITVDSLMRNEESTKTYINTNWDKIQLLTCPNDITEGGLYKFRGMVQDMLNPVYFYDTYEVVNKKTGSKELKSGKYRDCLDCSDEEEMVLDSEGCVNGQRKPYYCITIPGLNDWAQLNPIAESSVSNIAGPSHPEKRGAEEMETDDRQGNKRYRTEEGENSLSPPTDKSHPIPSPKNMSCIVHFYEDLPQTLKVTDMLEVVGFAYRTVVPQDDAENVPASHVPRLHAVACRPLKTSNPFHKHSTNYDEITREAKMLRAELHLVLTQLFLGDHLAADFFICHLLARVYKRMDCLVLGQMSMNLFNIPGGINYPQQVYKVLSKLMPTSHLFPMTLASMNTTNMSPRKDYDSDRLEAGLLQLTSKTHLVIDETQLKEGKLEEKGVENFKTLSYLISQQKLNYDFKYYNMDFETNVPVLVLSEGKSVLPSDIRLPLKPEESCPPTQEVFDSVLTYLREPLLSKLRLYLSVCSNAEFDLPSEVVGSIHDGFVKMRQTFHVTQDEMHIHMVLAKWMTISYGEKLLTNEIWEKLGHMEMARRERMPN